LPAITHYSPVALSKLFPSGTEKLYENVLAWMLMNRMRLP
jgi:hypothetical protein